MAARIGTLEQRKPQAEAIQRWKPWKRSPGPRSVQGKAKALGNIYSGSGWADLQQAVKALT